MVLFERRARGVTLTPAGHAFLPHARRILAAHDAARAAAQGASPVVDPRDQGTHAGTQAESRSSTARASVGFRKNG